MQPIAPDTRNGLLYYYCVHRDALVDDDDHANDDDYAQHDDDGTGDGDGYDKRAHDDDD